MRYALLLWMCGCGDKGGDESEAPGSPSPSFIILCGDELCETVLFDASASSSPNGEITGFAWDFGDGSVDEGGTVSHSFPGDEGSYEVTLTVTDQVGQIASIESVIVEMSIPAGADDPDDEPPSIAYVKGNPPSDNGDGTCRAEIMAIGGCYGTPFYIRWSLEQTFASFEDLFQTYPVTSFNGNTQQKPPYENQSYNVTHFDSNETINYNNQNYVGLTTHVLWDMDPVYGYARFFKSPLRMSSSFKYTCNAVAPIIEAGGETAEEDVFTRLYQDADADGYGDPATYVDAAVPLDGFVEDASDCDDSDSSVSPSAPEECDTYDNNCDGAVDEMPECASGEGAG